MKQITSLNVFIASPGDTKDERDFIERTIIKWNRIHGGRDNIELKPKRWEKDAPATSHVNGQELINNEILSECDILVGMFWTRFGSPTNKEESGTQEEIKNFLDANKRVILYFLDKEIRPNQVDHNELAKIKEFKNYYKDKGLYKEIPNMEDFEDKLIEDLSFNVNKVLKNECVSNYPQNEQSITPVSDDYKNNLNDQKQPWYTVSISNLINDFMENKGYSGYKFKRELTLGENLIRWKENQVASFDQLAKSAEKALCYAFDEKYGLYDYSFDLRKKYHDSWHEHAKDLIDDKFNSSKDLKVIGVGANYGLELIEIFGEDTTHKLEVLDISPKVLERGKERFKQIQFHEGRMEENQLPSSNYDVYLNLRSIHLRGADMSMAIGESYRCLKPKGLAIISVSNGYLETVKEANNKVREKKGLYNNVTSKFEEKTAYDLAQRIQEKMIAYGYTDVEWCSGPTEVFIYGVKG